MGHPLTQYQEPEDSCNAPNVEEGTAAMAISERAPHAYRKKAATSVTPGTTTNPRQERGTRNRPVASIGSVRSAVPINLGGKTTSGSGRKLLRPEAYNATPPTNAPQRG
jgi:hypothetical protein